MATDRRRRRMPVVVLITSGPAYHPRCPHDGNRVRDNGAMESRDSDKRRADEEARSRSVFEARDALSARAAGRPGARATAHHLLSEERMRLLQDLVADML